MREISSKLISWTLIIAILAPLTAMAQPVGDDLSVTTNSAPLSGYANESLPPFPEDLQEGMIPTAAPEVAPALVPERTPVEWADVDFEQEISLIADYNAYHQRIEELQRENKIEDLKNLKKSSHKLWDEEILDYFQAPPEVKDIVYRFKAGNEEKLWSQGSQYLNDQEFIREKEILGQDIRMALNKEEILSNEELELTQQIDRLTKFHPDMKAIDFQEHGKIERITQDKLVPLKAVGQPDFSGFSTHQKEKALVPKSERENFTLKKYSGSKSKLTYTNNIGTLPGVDVAKAADLPASPIMGYYEGIENNIIENALLFLSRNQNEEGSFGQFLSYDLSGQIALSLSRFNKTDNDQYLLLLDYLKNHEPQNNREKAIKARLMYGLGEPYQDLVLDLVSQKNVDGGYGLDNHYQSDIETTLEVIWALWVTNMGIEEQLPQALHFALSQIGTDGGMKYTENDVASYYLANKTLEYLFPFKTLSVGEGGNTISVQDKTNALLGHLISVYNTETETLQGSTSVIDELLTAYSFDLYDVEQEKRDSLLEEASYRQWFDGSFGDSLYGTVAALKALPMADLEILGIENTGTLMNGTALNLRLLVKNNGYANSSAARLHFIADNYLIYSSGPQELNIMPGEESAVSFTFVDTVSLIGNTELKFYIEQEREMSYENNWKSQAFAFANASNGALPMPFDYSAQHFPVEAVQGQPEVGIAFGWGPYKSAFDNVDVVGLFRPTGTSTWYVWHFDGGGIMLYNFPEAEFPEGVIVDTTVGIYDSSQGIYRYLPITQVQLSADRTKYFGGISGNVEIYGEPCIDCEVHAGFDGKKTDHEGFFENTAVPNGRVFVRAGYDQNEKILKAYNIPVEGTVTDVRVLTHLLPDSQAPVITTLKINGEDDFNMNNNHEAEIYLKVSENIAPSETNFYYFDPADNTWQFLGSSSGGYLGTSTQNVYEQSFFWYIPSKTHGSGYKIKAVVRDFHGNESAAVEWGPFTVIDTTDYTAPVVDEFYINGESDYQINSDQQYYLALWATDNGEITFCESEYNDPATGVWETIEARMCDGIGDVLIWDVPATVHGTGFKIRARVYDAFSNVSADKEWGPFTIMDSHPPDIEIPVIDGLELRYGSANKYKNQTSYQILVYGHDNTAFKEADLYYYDPITSGWEMIGTLAAINSTQVYQPWLIPASLFGPGYRLKAFVRDTSGNVSAPKEFGPFEVIDGTLPTGAIEVTGLTDGIWNLNETKTINWNLNTSTPLKGISSISLVYGASSTVIGSNYDISKTSIDYKMPFNSNYTTADAFIRMRVYDNNYNYGTIESSHFQIRDNSEPPHSPWAVPQAENLVLSATKLDRYIANVFRNNDGSTEIIYYEWDGWSHEEAGQYRRLIYRKFTGTEWGNPVVLNEYWYRNGQTNDVSLSSINAIKAGNEDIHLTYRRFEDTADSWELDENAAQLWYMHLRGAETMAVQQIQTGLSPSALSLAIDSQNRIYMGWRQGYDWVNRTGNTVLKHMEGDGLNSWTVPVTLVDGGVSDLLFTLENDAPLVVYRANGQFSLIKKVGTAWTAPVNIYKRTIPKATLDVFTEDSSKLNVIVEDDPVDSTLYRWLPEIKTRAALETILTNNAFVKKTEILNAWYANEYAYNTHTLNIFPRDNNEYDLFYLQSSQATNYRYNIYHLNFNADFQTQERSIIGMKALLDRVGNEDTRTYKMKQNGAANYHVFYTKTDADGLYRAYHLYYDRANTFFNTNVSALPMSVNDYFIACTENNNFLNVWFQAYLGGKNNLIFNSADYGPIINYQLKNLAPAANSNVANTSALLSWQLDGGEAETFDVFMGTDSNSMVPVGQDLNTTSHAVSGLEIGKTYLWQVRATNGTNQIYSNVSRFTVTAPADDCVAPVAGDWVISNSCTVTAVVNAPEDVIVQNNAVLTIETDAAINVDLTNHAVRIKPGSGIRIRPGGTLH